MEWISRIIIKNQRKTYYIRAGSTNREATREELRRLYQASGTFHYDGSSLLVSSPDDRILTNIGILAEEERRVCTVGGILLFGREPAQIFHSAGLTFASFSGTKITE